MLALAVVLSQPCTGLVTLPVVLPCAPSTYEVTYAVIVQLPLATATALASEIVVSSVSAT